MEVREGYYGTFIYVDSYEDMGAAKALALISDIKRIQLDSMVFKCNYTLWNSKWYCSDVMIIDSLIDSSTEAVYLGPYKSIKPARAFPLPKPRKEKVYINQAPKQSFRQSMRSVNRNR